MPTDHIYDGYDLSKVINGTGKSERDVVFYYRGTRVFAVRKGEFKAHFITKTAYGVMDEKVLDQPLLFNLDQDPAEKYNLAKQYPEIISEIRNVLQEHLNTLTEVENQHEKINRL